jgi:penicillin-binding protein 1A
VRAGLIALGAGCGVAFGQMAVTSAVDAVLPDARQISSFSRPGTLTILAADGSVVVKKGPATREKLPPGRMPELVERAFIAAEDRRFYRHDGVDMVGILRAALRNIRQGSVEEGASTITQQLARMVFLSQDVSLLRKLKEAALAGKIERQYSKQQILEQYLNYVYLGSSAYGVSDAAWVYFSKKPGELTLPEAALIAGLPPAPSVYSPLVNPDLALQRRSIVLRRMKDMGFISEGELMAAENTPLGLKPATPKYFDNPAPWFTSWLEQQLPQVLSKEQLEVGGITIRTGLDAKMQKLAQEIIDARAPGSMQGALVTMEPGTGLVKAMVGGKDWQKSQFNRATQALRSPGSTFKLFAYVAAMSHGLKPEDTVSNKAQCFGGFCVKAKGPSSTSVVNAVVGSLNAAAVATARKVGYPAVIETARKFGITSELGEYPSMVLGANEQYVIDMTAAYAAITNRGVYVPPTPFEEITGPDGELLWSRRVDGKRGKRAVSSDVADAMQWMLIQAVNKGTGTPARLEDRPVAGKTGTSEGARDLWFIGSLPQLTTGIWLGYDNNAKTRSSSAQAAYAWGAYMKDAVKGLPVQQFPPKPVLTGSFRAPASAKKRPAAPSGTARREEEKPELDPLAPTESDDFEALREIEPFEPIDPFEEEETAPAPRERSAPSPAPAASPPPRRQEEPPTLEEQLEQVAPVSRPPAPPPPPPPVPAPAPAPAGPSVQRPSPPPLQPPPPLPTPEPPAAP